MKYSKKELSVYRMERARESLQEAWVMGELQHWNTSSSRLYYACFYAVSAYLVINNIKASTHNGIKIAFNKELVLTGKIKEELGQLYNKLYKLREDADYRDFRSISEKIVLPLFNKVEELIDQMEHLIDLES